MRAISAFSLEAGTSTFGWRAWIALRTRVSMSAMGSLVISLLGGRGPGARGQGKNRRAKRDLSPTSGPRSPAPCLLPARLDHAWNLAVQRELAETQAADAEFAQKGARAPAAPAAVAVPGRQLGNSRLVLGLGQLGCPADNFQLYVFRNLGGSGHVLSVSPLLPERHPHVAQQRHAFRVGARRGG